MSLNFLRALRKAGAEKRFMEQLWTKARWHNTNQIFDLYIPSF